MTLRLYDTAARSMRDFVPLISGKASLYLCGATVQASPHVGHIRSGVGFDILVRWLQLRGYAVTFCRNVTDIDDKIIAKGHAEGRPWWAVSTQYEREFGWAYDVLGCQRPTVEPRATGHIPEMIDMMHELIASGHAYAVDGDVYFHVGSYPEYGSLSGQRPADMEPAGDSIGDSRKRDPRDFALWKAAKPGEPAWNTPWGPGRPGWHLECSAMARKYLGDSFDIHGGGLDLIFPHHENEIAQSLCAGLGFASYWIHNAWVTTGGEKMSKSLGNSLLVSEVVKRVRPIELRYYLVAAHYRSMIEYSPEALDEAAVGFRRIEGFLARAASIDATGDTAAFTSIDDLPADFTAALDDDLGTPQALAVVHARVREGNTALAADDRPHASQARSDVRAMLSALGLNPTGEGWSATTATGDRATEALDTLVRMRIDQRDVARTDRDFARADEIRDGLAALGIVLTDAANGTSWSLESSDGG